MGAVVQISRGRQPGFRMSDDHRIKIQNSQILNALIEHTLGKRDMSPTQVAAGLGLLKKVLPDLSAVTLEPPKDDGENMKDITPHEHGARIAFALQRALPGPEEAG